VLESLIVNAESRLERTDHIADHIFGSIMQQRGEAPFGGPAGAKACAYIVHQHTMFGNRERMIAFRLPVPPRNTGKPMRNVVNLDVQRRWVEQVEPSPTQHALPGAWLLSCFRHGRRNLRSFAASVDCMSVSSTLRRKAVF